jgi:hypothetical protein
VHERDLRSRRLDDRAMLRDVGQRFAAEGSTEVTQENQQDRRPLLQRVEFRRQRPAPLLR